jgi:hypothetical protein
VIDGEHVWLSRARWRMRGAWEWPTFICLTLAGGALLDVLPFYGSGPGGLMAGVLLVGFFNLALIAVVAPLAGRWLRRRRPDLPRAIAANYAGTALLCATFLALLAGGLVHRPQIAAEQSERREQLAAVRAYVAAHAPEYRTSLTLADTIRVESEMYRTCVPGADPKRWLCLFVRTDRRPPAVTVDTDKVPNAWYQTYDGFD